MKSYLAIVFFALTVSFAQAENLPSFDVQLCTWNATHIVEVTQGKKGDGVLTVHDSWQGDLKKGDIFTFPELRYFAREEQRRVFVFPGLKVLPWREKQVSGLRMVLFLKKGDGELEPGTPLRVAGWGDIKTSLAWIDGGEVFAFVQISNPGSQVICALDMTEKEFKDKVLQISQVKAKLKKAVAVEDLGKRAQSLALLVHSDLPMCRREALEALGRCGEKGLPVVLKLLKEKPLAPVTSNLLEALGKIGGSDAGKELVALLKEEFAFWQKRGPNLKGDWWSDWKQWDQRYLQARHAKFSAIIGALGEAEYPECLPLVLEVRDFLMAHPHLDTDYVSRWCRVILGLKQL